jgi:hypothetical protein
MSIIVDLGIDGNAEPVITRVKDDATPEDHAEHKTWANQYFNVWPFQSYRELPADVSIGSIRKSPRLPECYQSWQRCTPSLVCIT